MGNENKHLLQMLSMDLVLGFFKKAALVVTLALVIRPALGGIACENLPTGYCAFSVSSAGKRCVLEKYVTGTNVKFECKSSDVLVENMAGPGWIETDDCIQACGLQRNSVGISSDSLLETPFTLKLCSPKCYKLCPNIIELYFNLAAGEGVYLPKLCQILRFNSRGKVDIIRSKQDCNETESLAPSVGEPVEAEVLVETEYMEPGEAPINGEPLQPLSSDTYPPRASIFVGQAPIYPYPVEAPLSEVQALAPYSYP